jgi:hypothetical protein
MTPWCAESWVCAKGRASKRMHRLCTAHSSSPSAADRSTGTSLVPKNRGTAALMEPASRG